MKRTVISIFATCAALAASTVSCTRVEPSMIEGVTFSFQMPEEFKSNICYSGREISFEGSSSFKAKTDESGIIRGLAIIPGIYDISTSWEISGEKYATMVSDPSIVDRKAKVVLSVSVIGQRIFKSEDLSFALNSAVMKSLLISRIYYSGTRDNMDRTYTNDSYIEIFNNSDEVAYLDGKYLALAESVSPAAYPVKDNPDSIYARQVCRFPGNGSDYPVEPGKAVIIAAKSARNHILSAETSVDLSAADFEVKDVSGSGNPDVAMLPIISSSTNMKVCNLISGGPNAVYLFETEEDVLSWPEVYQRGKSSGERFRRMHRSVVLDGVECLKNNTQSGPDINTKRLHETIDAGYICISSVNGYNHEVVSRKVARSANGRDYLMDTNNSCNDFEVLTDPAVINKESRK